MARSLLAAWRDAVRDSDLPATAKLVGLVLSTYMDGAGYAFPSKETLAAGASISPRAVYTAIESLDAAGLLSVNRSKSRRGNRYWATGSQFDGNGTGQISQVTGQLTHGTGNHVPTKAVEREKRVTSLRKKKTGRVPTARPDLQYLDNGVIDV